jgi:phosphonate transport system ATP-binding protein
MADNILSIRALEKTYPNGVRALKGISFDVKKGEFLVVIGLSGSGKSTLLRCINRLHDPTSGEIIFKGSIDSHLHSEKDKPLDIAKAQGAEIKKSELKLE